MLSSCGLVLAVEPSEANPDGSSDRNSFALEGSERPIPLRLHLLHSVELSVELVFETEYRPGIQVTSVMQDESVEPFAAPDC